MCRELNAYLSNTVREGRLYLVEILRLTKILVRTGEQEWQAMRLENVGHWRYEMLQRVRNDEDQAGRYSSAVQRCGG